MCRIRAIDKIKEIILEMKICINCFIKISGSYHKLTRSKENPYNSCVICNEQTKPFGRLPICGSHKCKTTFYRNRRDRDTVIESLNNGGRVNFRIDYVKELGFKVKIESLPTDQIKILEKNWIKII